MKHRKFAWVLVLPLMFFASCGGGERYSKTALDKLIQKLSNVETYSIILYDMDVEGTFSNTYKHRYQVLKNVGDTVEQELMPWEKVSERTFLRYRDDMGMTIVSKSDGKLKKEVSPAGYANYVGNKQYGHWVQGSGGSFWEFYGKYAFMSSMFDLATYPIRRSYWNDYRTNYYGRNRAYYGPTVGGRSYYGTSSNYNRKKSFNSTWSKKTNGFKDRVSSRTSRSGSSGSRFSKSTGSSRSSSGSRFGSSSSSRSRSSSRYSGSSSRSRGGGFGK
ncbi:hypothetical protein FUAX_08590 [Fulvitalea axinellae]|uniref:Lipoprotein n=1 Tax=Fulvitalea axinellae TaxID=1182444 RepID=A0AAU9CKH9_9BACT|nr:hypothetical protein FUAX_08590 [Fulvitalea axinellae]